MCLNTLNIKLVLGTQLKCFGKKNWCDRNKNGKDTKRETKGIKTQWMRLSVKPGQRTI